MSDAELIRAMTKAYWAVGTGREDMAAVLTLVRAHDAARAAPVAPPVEGAMQDSQIPTDGAGGGNPQGAPAVEGGRVWPAAREDGAPVTCLRCNFQRTAKEKGDVWCDECFLGPASEGPDWHNDRDAWRAHRASLSKGGAT